MEDGFRINVDKACPACSTNCPELELESAACYGESWNGTVVIRNYYCTKRDICKNLWSHLVKYKNGLEGHN